MEKLGKFAKDLGSHLPGKEKATATNPFTGEVLYEFDFLSNEQVNAKIQESWNTYLKYRKSDPKDRAAKFAKLAQILSSNVDKFARIMSLEMGKPIKESRHEVRHAILECQYFAKNTENLLKREPVTDAKGAKEAYVVYQPLGVIFHVTPFNFPFSTLFRGTIGALAMGNTVINKNPANCPQIGLSAEEAFREAGFANGEFMNLIVSQNQSELIIKNDSIRGVLFTGSTEGGQKIGALAGQYCKKSVMELGGNDPFIVLKDSDLNLAVEQGVQARLLNAGQCCTAAKRFLIDESIYDEFKSRLLEKVKEIKLGDPLDESTQVGPIAKKSGLDQLLEQIKKAKKDGAKVLYGGEVPQKDEKLKKGNFIMPTILELDDKNSIYHEETFGPIFLLLKFKSESDVIRMANDSQYGLGCAIFSKDVKRAEELGQDIEAGAVYINHSTDWDVACPEGGVKMSGYGRDGGRQGAYEFANVKTVWIGQ